MEQLIDVYIVGSKGIPAQYGGFETFVNELSRGKKTSLIKYHVSCMNNDEKSFEYNDAECFNVRVPLRGPIGRILHVSRALKIVKKKHDKKNCNIVYILGCRIGPLMKYHYKQLKKCGFSVFVNPDGLEWKRDKWNRIEKKFLKHCERCLVVNSDLSICDSKTIQDYIIKSYGNKVRSTAYISYGAYVKDYESANSKFELWLKNNSISPNGYYLIVGRFVPENNYTIMISEFMKTKTDKDLVIISNVEKNKFYSELLSVTNFINDPRIKFVGTVYDGELLGSIRTNAFAYIHGHEVGGTNPSLLEALSSTNLNLLLDVGFNREVGEDAALYWTKEDGNLCSLIATAENISEEEAKLYGTLAKKRILDNFSWEKIINSYEALFLASRGTSDENSNG